MSTQTVKVLTDNDLKELQKIYEPHLPLASHVNSLLLTHFEWKRSHPEKNYLTFFALKDDWKRNGTFFMKFRNFEIFLFTLDETGESLYSLLRESKVFKVEPQKWSTVIYGIKNDHLPPVYRSLNELEIPIKLTVENKTYWLPKEEALNYKIKCPEEIYIGKINISHIDLICSLWPHTFAGAHEYLSTVVEMNGGYGLFLKENDQLVSWVLRNCWGTLIVLETVPEHKRKGYGSLITKKTCLEIAKEGINPIATILNDNIASENLFSKLGFRHTDNFTFLSI